MSDNVFLCSECKKSAKNEHNHSQENTNSGVANRSLSVSPDTQNQIKQEIEKDYANYYRRGKWIKYT